MTEADGDFMTGFLLDTNVVSEPFRVDPEPLVVEFLASQLDLWLSSIVLHDRPRGICETT